MFRSSTLGAQASFSRKASRIIVAIALGISAIAVLDTSAEAASRSSWGRRINSQNFNSLKYSKSATGRIGSDVMLNPQPLPPKEFGGSRFLRRGR